MENTIATNRSGADQILFYYPHSKSAHAATAAAALTAISITLLKHTYIFIEIILDSKTSDPLHNHNNKEQKGLNVRVCMLRRKKTH